MTFSQFNSPFGGQERQTLRDLICDCRKDFGKPDIEPWQAMAENAISVAYDSGQIEVAAVLLMALGSVGGETVNAVIRAIIGVARAEQMNDLMAFIAKNN